MPIHDWTRVSAGVFHDFHCGWIVETRNALNNGILPPEYYAMAEQIAGGLGPDVLALENKSGEGPPAGSGSNGAGVRTTALAPPKVRFILRAVLDEYVSRQRRIVIRHSSGDRIVALLEIVSPGNKASRHALRAFVDKAVTAICQGYHLLITDLFPPTRRDPNGIHGAIWTEICDQPYEAPADKPLTIMAYAAGAEKTAYVEPVAVNDLLPDMPLFLDPDTYVMVPLETTYQTAWRGMPRRWRGVLETPPL